MFQNDKWVILLNFYKTREDLTMLKMFVSTSGLREGMSDVCHGRDSTEKPLKPLEQSMLKAVVY